MAVEQMVTIIYAGNNGYLDDIAVGDIQKFEKGFHPFMAESYPDVMEKLAETKNLDKDTEAVLVKAITAYKAQFAA
jgi:F-type H+-transporting ATPase subunit alpha